MLDAFSLLDLLKRYSDLGEIPDDLKERAGLSETVHLVGYAAAPWPVFKKKMLEFHPDKYSGTNKTIRSLMLKETKRINEAYSVLKNEDTRLIYDRKYGF